jgi:hypothetical protein
MLDIYIWSCDDRYRILDNCRSVTRSILILPETVTRWFWVVHRCGQRILPRSIAASRALWGVESCDHIYSRELWLEDNQFILHLWPEYIFCCGHRIFETSWRCLTGLSIAFVRRYQLDQLYWLDDIELKCFGCPQKGIFVIPGGVGSKFFSRNYFSFCEGSILVRNHLPPLETPLELWWLIPS